MIWMFLLVLTGCSTTSSSLQSETSSVANANTPPKIGFWDILGKAAGFDTPGWQKAMAYASAKGSAEGAAEAERARQKVLNQMSQEAGNGNN